MVKILFNGLLRQAILASQIIKDSKTGRSNLEMNCNRFKKNEHRRTSSMKGQKSTKFRPHDKNMRSKDKDNLKTLNVA